MAVKTVFQLLPKEFDEKVVKLHFPVLGAELTLSSPISSLKWIDSSSPMVTL